MPVNFVYYPNRNIVSFNAFFLWDENLSLEEKGLLGFLLSMPHKWKMNKKFISDRFNLSTPKLNKIIDSLLGKKYGIIEESGKDNYYYFFDAPFDNYQGNVLDYAHCKTQIESMFPTAKKVATQKPEKRVREFNPESEEYKLAKMLHEKTLAVDPGKKEPNLHIWAKSFQKMRYVDGVSFGQLKEAIDWIFRSNYWSKQITSPSRLSWSWGTIRTQMNNGKGYDNNSYGNAQKEIVDWLKE